MELNYKEFGSGYPLVILHGLLGSLDNWQAIAKNLAAHFRVFILDQRNHGRSPHSDEFNYDILAADLLEFFNKHHIEKAHLIGHSMGGKAAMQFALLHPGRVKKLIVVDITPAAFEDRHNHVFQALLSAPLKEARSREEIQAHLRKMPEDENTVQFLMKGLIRNEEGTSFEWRFHASGLYARYAEIASAITASHPYAGPALFIKGQRSGYINGANYGSVADLFPNHQLAEVPEAGHWVHAENPEGFIKEVRDFLTHD